MIGQLIELSENVGFALATMKQFSEPSGISPMILNEAITRLESCFFDIKEIIDEHASRDSDANS